MTLYIVRRLLQSVLVILIMLVLVFVGVYVIGTFFGIIPGSFVFASVGAGLGSIFEAGGEFSAKGILTPQVMIALVGLAALSLIPVVYKKIKSKEG